MNRIPQVTPREVIGFARQWKTKGGVSIVMDDLHAQLACDFANTCIVQLVQQLAAAQQQPKVQLADQ